MAKNKYYVVLEGYETGVYDNWKECESKVKGYPKAKYKGYPNLEEANEAFKNKEFTNNKTNKSPSSTSIIKDYKDIKEIDLNTLSVDGACSGNPGIGEYQCVDVSTNEVLFTSGKCDDVTNNIMEYMALVEGIQYLLNTNSNKKIYTDSITALSWIKNKKVKSVFKKTNKNESIYFIFEKYVKWVEDNYIDLDLILKWKTKEWGEIPADFGRK